MFCWVFGKLSAAYIDGMDDVVVSRGRSSNQNRGGRMVIRLHAREEKTNPN